MFSEKYIKKLQTLVRHNYIKHFIYKSGQLQSQDYR